MEEEVKSRMQLILKEFETNPTQLANQFGVNQKTLNSHINGNTAVSLSTILLILKAFPEVSAEWLLRGDGNMKADNQELCMNTDLELSKKESEVYLIWMEYMKFNERMQELYQKQKEK